MDLKQITFMEVNEKRQIMWETLGAACISMVTRPIHIYIYTGRTHCVSTTKVPGSITSQLYESRILLPVLL